MPHDIIFGTDLIKMESGSVAASEHPTMNLRYLDRRDMDRRSHISLQQEWAIVTFDGMNRVIDRKTEWRDVPVVVE